MSKEEAIEIAIQHWKWLEKWIQEVPPPEDHPEFVRLMSRMYIDAFVHGYKHAEERMIHHE